MGKLNWGMKACGIFLLWVTAAIALPAQTLTTLHSFDNTDGASPVAGMIQHTHGDLYGTASAGGASGGGTIFKITTSGMLTTSYSFCSQSNCTDGANPVAALTQGTDGNPYGTTSYGGANGAGTVFRITDGTLTTLYSFCSQLNCTDGEVPRAGLVQGTDGNFYGTTSGGGVGQYYGTVFKITPGGVLTTLYTFCSQLNCADGAQPEAALVQGTDGNFYGTTVGGGNGSWGTIFKITPTGTLTTLRNICTNRKCTDGIGPNGLVQASDGNFYGTTRLGGGCFEDGCGTVFKITPRGKLTTLYHFCMQYPFPCPDGENPNAGLSQGTDGNLYGTTTNNGANGWGTIFKITRSGTLTTLYNLCSQLNCADGGFPEAALVQDTNGKFYGTTYYGGNVTCASGCGTVFSLSVGLGPFVKTQPTFGTVGASVAILGTDLTGATSVTFNGTPASFTVVASSYITTSVPAGATTGKVEVTTPHHTLKSNEPFRVQP
jgi:uncharacterized repeat protein (TIGR03803 family)